MTLSFDDEKRQIEVEKEDDKKTIRKSGIISMQKATENQSCRVYEIKHTTEAFSLQCRHLLDEEKCSLTERYYGKIIEKCVLYRGTSFVDEQGVEYHNVSEYLRTIVK